MTQLPTRQQWAITLMLLCALQWLSLSAHAIPSHFPPKANPALAIEASSNHSNSTHCHQASVTNLLAKHPSNIAAERGESTQPDRHGCCDDDCSMLDCHLPCGIVSESQSTLSVQYFTAFISPSANFVSLPITPLDRPPRS